MSGQPEWFKEELGSRLTPLMRTVLIEYSGVPDESLVEHVEQVRSRAWKLYKYPCIGQWQFLYSPIKTFPFYRDVLECALREGSILDLGCCFAQDLRVLAADGAPTKRMYASDIVGDFWGLGLKLFRDEGRIEAKFVQADVFDPSSALTQWEGRMDVVLATHFFHLFDRNMQIQAAENIIRLLRPGGRIFGYNIGSITPREVSPQNSRGSKQTNSKYYHDETTFKKMWLEIGEKTNTSWIVEASLSPLEDWGMPREDFEWMSPSARGLSFSITHQPSKL